MAKESAQMSLTTERVKLTDEEKIERGTSLANLIREAAVMAEQHSEKKKSMREEEQALDQEIAELADVVRTGEEDRAITRK